MSSWNHRYHQLSNRLERLQHDFNEMTVRNAETVYFLQLELDTTRRSKEAVEDRMAELYRDMQDLQDYNNHRHQNSNSNHKNRPPFTVVSADVDDSVAMMMKSHQTQIEKYERMLRIMNNQISLLKASSESMVKSLKDEITDLMDDKTKSEIALWNRIHDLERENQDMYNHMQTTAVVAANQTNTGMATGTPNTMMLQHSSNYNEKVAPPRPPQRHKSIETTEEDEPNGVDDHDEKHAAATTLFVMRQELRRLRSENRKLKQQLAEDHAAAAPCNNREIEPKMREQIQQLTQSLENLKTELDIQRETASKNLDAWTEEKAALVQHIADLESKTLPHTEQTSNNSASSSVLAVSREPGQLQEQHNGLPPASSTTIPNADNEQETAAMGSELERVALFYERADESIQALETIIMELRINHSDEAAKLVSTLEMASAVHSQIKLSLMLIELKFRNNMGSIVASLAANNPDVPVESAYSNGKRDVKYILQQIERMKQETSESIADVEALLTLQMDELRTKSMEESTHLRELHDSKVADLKQIQSRHAQLEAEIERYLSNPTDLKGSTGVVPAITATATTTGSDVVVSQQALQTLQTEVLQVVHRIKEKNEIIARLTAEIQEHKIRERTLMEELKRHMREQADRQLAEQHRIMQQNARRMVSRQETDEDDEFSEEELSEYEEQTVDDDEIVYEA